MKISRKLVATYFIGEFLSVAGMGLALFWSAGRMDWWPAWGAIFINLAWLTSIGILILRFNPALLAERISPPKGAKTWDTLLNLALRLLSLAQYIVAGLDQRHAWTSGFPASAQWIALLVCALGYALFAWAAGSNAFFSQIVRIQSERGHTVADGGPYRCVRHPAYVGSILYQLAVSVLFASWWTFIPSIMSAILMIVRTALEDRTLQAELPGYEDYSRRVRYRLLPGIW